MNVQKVQIEFNLYQYAVTGVLLGSLVCLPTCGDARHLLEAIDRNTAAINAQTEVLREEAETPECAP